MMALQSQTRMLSSSYPIPKEKCEQQKSLFALDSSHYFALNLCRFCISYLCQMPTFPGQKMILHFGGKVICFSCPVTASLKYSIFPWALWAGNAYLLKKVGIILWMAQGKGTSLLNRIYLQ